MVIDSRRGVYRVAAALATTLALVCEVAVFVTLLTRQGMLSALLVLLSWSGLLLSGPALARTPYAVRPACLPAAGCPHYLDSYVWLQPGYALVDERRPAGCHVQHSRDEPRLLGERGIPGIAGTGRDPKRPLFLSLAGAGITLLLFSTARAGGCLVGGLVGPPSFCCALPAPSNPTRVW